MGQTGLLPGDIWPKSQDYPVLSRQLHWANIKRSRALTPKSLIQVTRPFGFDPQTYTERLEIPTMWDWWQIHRYVDLRE